MRDSEVYVVDVLRHMRSLRSRSLRSLSVEMTIEGEMTNKDVMSSEVETSRPLKNFMSKMVMVEREKILSYKNVC